MQTHLRCFLWVAESHDHAHWVVSSPLDDICIDILKDEPRRQRDSNVDNDDDITMTTITMALDYNGNDCGDIDYVDSIDH